MGFTLHFKARKGCNYQIGRHGKGQDMLLALIPQFFHSPRDVYYVTRISKLEQTIPATLH